MRDGKSLKKFIEAKGYKAAWIARKVCNPPVHVTTMNRWLNHGDAPSGLHGFDHRDQISRFFGVSFWGGSIK